MSETQDERIALLAQIAYGIDPILGLANAQAYNFVEYARETGMINAYWKLKPRKWMSFNDYSKMALGFGPDEVLALDVNRVRALARGVLDSLSNKFYGKPFSELLPAEDVESITNNGLHLLRH